MEISFQKKRCYFKGFKYLSPVLKTKSVPELANPESLGSLLKKIKSLYPMWYEKCMSK
jgi:hypothetical protein